MPTWLSTHPDPERRWHRLAEEASLEPMRDAAALAADHERYLSRLDGLVVGEDPRNGVVDGNVYTHRRDRFRIAFPQGWSLEREGRTVTATNAAEDAAVLVLRGPETSVAAAEAALRSEEGLTTSEPWQETLGGMRARVVGFNADLEGTAVRGYAALVSLGGSVLKVIALSEAEVWESRQHALYGAIRTLRRLDPREVAAARPERLRMLRLRRPATLRQLAPHGTTAADLARLALLNDLPADALDQPLPAGLWVKLLVTP